MISFERLIWLFLLVLSSTCAQRLLGATRVILEDSKVRVSTRELAPHQSFTVTGAAPFGTVLIRVDGTGLCGDSKGNGRIVANGDPCLVTARKTVTFENTTGHTIAVLIVDILQQEQPLTVDNVVLALDRRWKMQANVTKRSSSRRQRYNFGKFDMWATSPVGFPAKQNF